MVHYWPINDQRLFVCCGKAEGLTTNTQSLTDECYELTRNAHSHFGIVSVRSALGCSGWNTASRSVFSWGTTTIGSGFLSPVRMWRSYRISQRSFSTTFGSVCHSCAAQVNTSVLPVTPVFLSRYSDFPMSGSRTCRIATSPLCFLMKLMD